MKLTTEVELVPFTVPNFVSVKMPARPRQDGPNFEAPKYSIAELDDKTLDLLCRKFREDVFAKAIEGRKASSRGDWEKQ